MLGSSNSFTKLGENFKESNVLLTSNIKIGESFPVKPIDSKLKKICQSEQILSEIESCSITTFDDIPDKYIVSLNNASYIFDSEKDLDPITISGMVKSSGSLIEKRLDDENVYFLYRTDSNSYNLTKFEKDKFIDLIKNSSSDQVLKLEDHADIVYNFSVPDGHLATFLDSETIVYTEYTNDILYLNGFLFNESLETQVAFKIKIVEKVERDTLNSKILSLKTNNSGTIICINEIETVPTATDGTHYPVVSFLIKIQGNSGRLIETFENGFRDRRCDQTLVGEDYFVAFEKFKESDIETNGFSLYKIVDDSLIKLNTKLIFENLNSFNFGIPFVDKNNRIIFGFSSNNDFDLSAVNYEESVKIGMIQIQDNNINFSIREPLIEDYDKYDKFTNEYITGMCFGLAGNDLILISNIVNSIEEADEKQYALHHITYVFPEYTQSEESGEYNRFAIALEDGLIGESIKSRVYLNDDSGYVSISRKINGHLMDQDVNLKSSDLIDDGTYVKTIDDSVVVEIMEDSISILDKDGNEIPPLN